MATIALLGTMDTKGDEHGFVAEQIRARGHWTLVIDVGTDQAPRLNPDITREEVGVYTVKNDKITREQFFYDGEH